VRVTFTNDHRANPGWPYGFSAAKLLGLLWSGLHPFDGTVWFEVWED
jgi:hypothetical protein